MKTRQRLFVVDVARATKLNPASVRKLAGSGRIRNVKRDYNNWRTFSKEAIDEVRRLAGTEA